MKCEYCNRLNLRNVEECAYCGAPFSSFQKQKQIKQIIRYTPPECSQCHTALSPSHTFCPNCHKISTDIAELVERNTNYPPQKFRAFYDETPRRQLLRCPHCKQKHRSRRVLPRLLDNPMIRCKHCHLPFIDPYVYEWSMVSTLHKLHYCFLANYKWTIPFILWALLKSFNVQVGLLVIPISALLCIGYVVIMHYDTILASTSRRKANPEYDKLLKKMGYDLLKSKRN